MPIYQSLLMIYNYLTTTNFPKGCTNCEERISNFCCSTAWNGICCEFPLKVRIRTSTSKLHVINNSNSKIFTLLNQSGPRQMTMIHGTGITLNISNFQFSLFQKFLEIKVKNSYLLQRSKLIQKMCRSCAIGYTNKSDITFLWF